MLDKLKIAKYRFVLQATEAMHLPPYKGATLRGGFGQAFKQIACSMPGAPCNACSQQVSCAYSYVFETPVPPDSEVLRTHEAVPRPFVIEPPLDGETEFRAGDDLFFELVLIGKGIEYLPYFVLAFRELGRQGLGYGRGHFLLKQIWAIDPLGPWQTLVYDGATDSLRNAAMTAQMGDIERLAGSLADQDLIVQFLTPTVLKHNDAITREPDFHILIRSLLRRISSLYYFHCGERWEADYRNLIEQAQMVETVEATVRWQDWERYSTRQHQRIEMGGLVGCAHYSGPITDFRSILVLGSIVHVGKASVFGSGKYLIL
jgi:hypothetical protein